jgi:hypothetical protein
MLIVVIMPPVRLHKGPIDAAAATLFFSLGMILIRAPSVHALGRSRKVLIESSSPKPTELVSSPFRVEALLFTHSLLPPALVVAISLKFAPGLVSRRDLFEDVRLVVILLLILTNPAPPSLICIVLGFEAFNVVSIVFESFISSL